LAQSYVTYEWCSLEISDHNLIYQLKKTVTGRIELPIVVHCLCLPRRNCKRNIIGKQKAIECLVQIQLKKHNEAVLQEEPYFLRKFMNDILGNLSKLLKSIGSCRLGLVVVIIVL
jgi:hypothetical protein